MQEIKLSPCCGSTDDWKVIPSLSPIPLIGKCIYLHIFIDTYLSTYIYIYQHVILYTYTHLRVFPPQHFWHHLGPGYYLLKRPSWHCGTLSSLPRLCPLDAHSPPHPQFKQQKTFLVITNISQVREDKISWLKITDIYTFFSSRNIHKT